MDDCIFCKIIAGEIPCHRIWEDDEHLAFLSIFPNTDGFSVVIPKAHYSSYAFDLDDKALSGLVLAAKRVGKLIDKNLPGVGRTGMILEGFGINHVHAKLFPMHGTGELKEWRKFDAYHNRFFNKYEGYMSSHDFDRMDDARLAEIAAIIRGEPR
jgi:diadenosine tetraphosphate (Ap4A) HIT family hydrolase